jgi:hypothetical protein
MAKSVALVVATPSVSDAISVVDAEIKSLKHIEDSVYKTHGRVKGLTGEIDIKTVTDVDVLVGCLASINTRSKAIEEAYDELGITTYKTVKIDGHTKEEWLSDISLRIQIIQHKDRLDELNTFKKEWVELMDKDDRKAALAKKMAASGLSF